MKMTFRKIKVKKTDRKFDFAGRHKNRVNHPLSSAPYPIFSVPSHIRRPPHRFLSAGKLSNQNLKIKQNL